MKVAAQTMSIIATIMNSSTGLVIQKMKFERMPKPWVTLHLESGEQVTADRVHVGKPAPGKFSTPVGVWVTPKGKSRAAVLGGKHCRQTGHSGPSASTTGHSLAPP